MTSILESPITSGEEDRSADGSVDDVRSPSARRPWRLLMGSSAHTYSSDVVEVGGGVTVRTQYLGSWTSGFEVAKLLEDGYLIRRVSDGALLPEVVAFDNVRRTPEG
jgi:hypothetical protein